MDNTKHQLEVYSALTPHIDSAFYNPPKPTPIKNPNKDRSLSGKSRRRARKDR